MKHGNGDNGDNGDDDKPPREMLESVNRLTRDEARAAATLSEAEARYLVDAYYQLQDNRIRADHQKRQMVESGEPHDVLIWLGDQASTLEKQVLRALDRYSLDSPFGEWPRSVCGIGPVIAAGLIAHIDITKAPTVGHIWRFGGLDPTLKWLGKKKARLLADEIGEGKGKLSAEEMAELSVKAMHVEGWIAEQVPNGSRKDVIALLAKLPWNAQLKKLCAYKIGESFVLVQGNEKDVYGKVYAERKAFEIKRNDAGENAELSASILAAKRFGKATEAFGHYSAGHLPPAHIHARARRYAVKLFLAHLHDVWFRLHYKKAPPLPYPIAHLGHTHKIDPQ